MVTIDKYFQTESDVQKIFINSELNSHFEIRTNVKWQSHQNSIEFDIVLYNNYIIYAIVEIKAALNVRSLNDAKKHLNYASKLTNCRFGIITDNITFYIIDFTQSDNSTIKKDFSQIVQLLINPNNIVQAKDKEKDIKNALSIFFKNANIIDTIYKEDIRYDDSQGFTISQI